MKPRIFNLRCACCGGSAPALKQWWNQDTGYGVCKRCFDHVKEKYNNKSGYEPDYAEQTYGKPGTHHSLEDTQPKHDHYTKQHH